MPRRSFAPYARAVPPIHNGKGHDDNARTGPMSDIEPSIVSSLREPRIESSAYPVRETRLQLLAVDGNVEACQHGIDRIGNGEMVAAGEQQTHGFAVVLAFGAEHDE